MTYQLHLGDCLEFMRGLPDGCIDAVVTDPPYGIDYNPQQFKKWDGAPSSFHKIEGDNKPFDPLPFLNVAPKVVLFGANNFAHCLPVGGWICWDKRLSARADRMFGSPFELAWVKANNDRPPSFNMARIQHGGVINTDSRNGNNDARVHPTQKPVALMKRILDILEIQGGATVFDPFMGSGSTGIACMQLGINFIGCEIDEGYFSIAQKRIEAAAAQGIFDLTTEAVSA